MRTEIIAVGTELLLGQILNRNAQFLSQELAKIGVDCLYHTTVGDNRERIKQSLKLALNRVDIVISTGGLGPTPDDLTLESFAELLGVEMILDEKSLDHIKEFFYTRAGRDMPPSNRKQALRPITAKVLPNPDGTAPGVIWNVTEHCLNINGIEMEHELYVLDKNGKRHDYLWEGEGNIQSGYRPKFIITFPGVPRELKSMWSETALPFLRDLSEHHLLNATGQKQTLEYRELKFYGIGESSLAEKISDLLQQSDTTVAPLASDGECRLRIATKACNREIAIQKIQETEDIIRSRVGDFIYGVDRDTLESVVAQLLKTHCLTVSLAESCTGGLVSQRLTDIAGSSAYTSLNLITYSNQSKINMLGVKEASLETWGAVSEQVAQEMATGIQNLSGSDYGLAITGIAGPESPSTDKSVGLVYLALANKEGSIIDIECCNFGARQRSEIRYLASQAALNMLRLALL